MNSARTVRLAADSKFRRPQSRRGRQARPVLFERLESRMLLDGALGAELDSIDEEQLIAEPRIVVVTDPDRHVLTPGKTYRGFPVGDFTDGVADLTVFTTQGVFGCTGSLLWSGEHVLTASHCVTDFFGNLIATRVDATFQLPGGDVTISGDIITPHPDYDGNVLNGGDVAIVQLDSAPPADAERYDIYRNSDEVGKVGLKVGYGLTGVGDTGGTDSGGGSRRGGFNRYDALGDVVGGAPGTQLMYDFDNGNPANDAFGGDTGLGNVEVNSAPGDSGGPTFINQQIAGVTSYGLLTPATDIDFTFSCLFTGACINSTYGERSGDARVSNYADFIDSVVNGVAFSSSASAASSASASALAVAFAHGPSFAEEGWGRLEATAPADPLATAADADSAVPSESTHSQLHVNGQAPERWELATSRPYLTQAQRDRLLELTDDWNQLRDPADELAALLLLTPVAVS